MTAPDLTTWPLDKLLWTYRLEFSDAPLTKEIRAEIERRCSPQAPASSALVEAADALYRTASDLVRSDPEYKWKALRDAQGAYLDARAALSQSTPPAPPPEREAGRTKTIRQTFASQRLNIGPAPTPDILLLIDVLDELFPPSSAPQSSAKGGE